MRNRTNSRLPFLLPMQTKETAFLLCSVKSTHFSYRMVLFVNIFVYLLFKQICYNLFVNNIIIKFARSETLLALVGRYLADFRQQRTNKQGFH